MKLHRLCILVALASMLVGLTGVLAFPSDGFSSDDESGQDQQDGEMDANRGKRPVGYEEDGVVQENPQYEYPSKFLSESHVAARDGDDDDDGVDQERREASKAAIGHVLANSTTTRKAGGVRRRASTLLRRHGFKITLALAVVAFRKELRSLAWQLCSKPVRDPETGALVRVPAPPSATAILKILVFVDLVRRMESLGGNGSGPSKVSPLAALLLAGGRGNPALAALLSRLWEPSNAAYIPPVEQHYTFERINNRYNRDADALRRVLSSPTQAVPPTGSAGPGGFNETVVILDWTNLDSSLSQLNVLRDEVSFLLSQYRNESWSDVAGGGMVAPLSRTMAVPRSAAVIPPAPALRGTPSVEVVVVLESPGGSASEYALAAQQIQRLRHRGLPVTVCVDKVAASGGYMIACTASPGRLFAAPLAVVGSIGVVGQSLNVHKVLRGWGVEPLVFRGGRDKAPVGLIGEVTDEGLQKIQQTVDSVHRAFQRHVVNARPVLAGKMDELATGDVWLACDAVELGLVDRLVTSDEYVEERLSDGARVLKLTRLVRPKYPFGRPTTTTATHTTGASSMLSRDGRGGLGSWLDGAVESSVAEALVRRIFDVFRAMVRDTSAVSALVGAATAAPAATPLLLFGLGGSSGGSSLW